MHSYGLLSCAMQAIGFGRHVTASLIKCKHNCLCCFACTVLAAVYITFRVGAECYAAVLECVTRIVVCCH